MLCRFLDCYLLQLLFAHMNYFKTSCLNDAELVEGLAILNLVILHVCMYCTYLRKVTC